MVEIKHLIEGNFAPDFTLDVINEDKSKGKFTLSDCRGKKNVILYFYPKDMTPGCTQEACDFRDNFSKFISKDTVVIGVSKDTLESHEKFVSKYDLNFILASDANSTVCEAYNCWVEKNMYGKKYMGVQRDTYLIDKTGKIKKIWRKVSVSGHIEEVYNAI